MIVTNLALLFVFIMAAGVLNTPSAGLLLLAAKRAVMHALYTTGKQVRERWTYRWPCTTFSPGGQFTMAGKVRASLQFSPRPCSLDVPRNISISFKPCSLTACPYVGRKLEMSLPCNCGSMCAMISCIPSLTATALARALAVGRTMNCSCGPEPPSDAAKRNFISVDSVMAAIGPFRPNNSLCISSTTA